MKWTQLLPPPVLNFALSLPFHCSLYDPVTRLKGHRLS